MILVENADYNTKIAETEKKNHDSDKYITTQESNKLMADIFKERLAQSNLATKTDIADIAKDFNDKLKSLNTRITSYKANHVLIENEKMI